MSVSRRRFLMSGAVVSAAFVLKPSTLAFGDNSIRFNSAANAEVQTKLYSREMFAPFIGDTFRVNAGAQVVDLKLVALTDEQPVSEDVSRTVCFSLQFQSMKPLPVPATIHTLNHSKLGDFDLFMVQSKIGPKFSQTAIVNHLE